MLKDLYFLRKKCKTIVFLSISGILGYFIFLTPPTKLKNDYKPFICPEADNNCDLTQENKKLIEKFDTGSSSHLIKRELDKSITEIENRIEHESKWFEYNSAPKKLKITVFIVVHFILMLCMSITHISPNMLRTRAFGLWWVDNNLEILGLYFLASILMTSPTFYHGNYGRQR